jgi:ribonuclease P protein component
MRIGLIVPRFKHSAVARNRLKRRLRELSRLRLLPAALPTDVVLRIRPDAYEATFEALASDVTRALEQLTRWCAMAGSGQIAPPAHAPSTPPSA